MNSNSTSRTLRAAALAAALLASAGALAQQQAAGRVLIAVGTVTVERGAERIAAATGTEVRKGDTIRVDAQSNAQVRFADGALVALRSGTTFQINEFSYQSEAKEKDGVLFSLLKGGLRTVTGALGRTNREEYSVNTPTATIGIRGTHYVLRVCDDDCEDGTGTAQAEPLYLASAGEAVSDAGPIAQAPQASNRAPNGTYGSVSEGRINVANQSGSRLFGADQYFHVASSTAPPQPLIGPPVFLRDRLEGRGRGERRGQGQPSGGAQQQQQQQQQAAAASSTGTSGSETATTMAPTGQGAGAGDTRSSTTSAAPVTAPVSIATVTQVTNAVSITPTTVVQPTSTSTTLFYRLAGTSLNIPITSCTGTGGCLPITAADFIVAINPATQSARIVLAGTDSAGSAFNMNNVFGDFPVTISGNTMTVNATVNAADYPNNQGSFRCSDCGPNNGVGVFTTITYKVSISGGQATLTVTAIEPTGGGTATAVLPLVDNTANRTAVIAGRNFGTNSGASVYTQVNAAGQPIYIGEPLGIGSNITKIGNGVNQTLGSDPAGNLQWGTWTGQATGVNGLYVPFTQSPGSVSPWIVGDLTNVLPTSLGSNVSFTPIGWVVGNGGAATGTLNSALLTADFVNRSVTFNASATNQPGGATYVMNGVSAFSAINGRFGAALSSVSCSGAGCIPGPLTPSSGFNGFFAGANAAGAGVAFSVSNGTNLGVVGAVGFKR